MIRKLILAASIAALPVGATAAPETFTFTSSSKNIDSLQLPAATQGGRPSGAGVFTLDTKTTYTDGKVTQIGGKCSQWILPPDAQFGSNMVCSYREGAEEVYTVRITCEVPGATQNCWGKLIGTGGRFKGRTGAFTSRGTGQGNSIGAGVWN